MFYADLSQYNNQRQGQECRLSTLHVGRARHGFTSQVELKSSDGRHRVALQSPVGEVQDWSLDSLSAEREHRVEQSSSVVGEMLDSLWEDTEATDDGELGTKKLRVMVTLLPEDLIPTSSIAKVESLQALEAEENLIS